MSISLAIDGAFRDSVLDAQSAFRAIMAAMAEPGSVLPLASLPCPPAPLSPSAAATVLTLCDHDTPLWIDPAIAGSSQAKAWIAFHTGAPITANPIEAHFALAAHSGDLIALENFAQGTQDYPDRSTTLILQVETLHAARSLSLQGPGIETVAHMAPHPLPRHFAEQWGQNNRRFPRGLDVVFAAPEGVACLARTTRIIGVEG